MKTTLPKNPLLASLLRSLAPLAQKHITPDNLSQLFSSLTAPYQQPDQRTILIISRKADDTVVASVCSLDSQNRITAQHHQQPLDQLIQQFIINQTR